MQYRKALVEKQQPCDFHFIYSNMLLSLLGVWMTVEEIGEETKEIGIKKRL